MAKTKTTINFEDFNLIVEKGADIATGELFIFQILDPTSTLLYTNAGYPAIGESPSFAAPDLDQATADTVVLSIGSLTTAIVQGTYTINYYKAYSPSGNKLSSGAITVTYCPTLPIIDLNLTYSCLTAEITSTDATSYGMVCSCSGETTEPSVTYAHTFKYPTNMITPIANETNTAAILSASELWTDTNVSILVSSLSYAMPTESYTGITTFYIVGDLEGTDSVDVVCSDCNCEMLTCLTAIVDRYQDALAAGNSMDIYKYMHLVEQILAKWMLYMQNQQCGTESELREICGEIKDLIGSECTCCDEEDDNEWSTQVTAVAAGSTTTSGTQWTSGADAPTGGANGDFYLRTSNGAIYKNILGTWTVQFTMSITSLLSNYIMYEVYTAASTTSGSLASLGTTTFDLADVKDGTAIVAEANFTFEEDTTSDTQIQTIIDGETAVTDNFYVDTTNDGTSFTASVKITYYVEDTGGLGTLYIVARKFELVINNAVIKTSFVKGMTLELSTTGNSFIIKGKTDGTKYISLDTLKVIQEQTTA